MMEKNLKIAIQASLEAGEVIMQVYNSTFDVEIKDDKSPLTEADKKANTVINTYLKDTGIPIISEENKQTDYNTRRLWDSCWVVDPVDGTKEFIKRNGEFTVNIALVKDGKPQYGVVYVPESKTIYIGDVIQKAGYKATLNTHQTSIEELSKRMKPLEPKGKEGSTIQVVGSRSHMSPETSEFIDSLKATGKEVEVVSKGSSLKFCLVAEGNADVYPRFAPTMEWDTAAGHAVCNAVGLEVISKATNEPLLYNKENLLNPWFIVSKH